ncbi:MAG: precorrin-4 C(11)-methyltransferase [Methanomicrobiales archaeon]|nr:precorrin-4 C(11)-methyltransferase [Methanomicrobiales archaeon]MDI6876426.1 precorrin-4 C(11)-methyltransferase [Methanomicrobiales archaeon]
MTKVYFVGAGPGDPDLITVKGRRLLERADVLIYTGSLVNPALVALSGAPLKMNSHGMHLPELLEAMASNALAGRTVVRLHSGDPSLYGAIVEQIDGLAERGVDVEIVPGVSSLFAAAAALKTQLTLRGVSDTLIVTRPRGRTLGDDALAELSRHGATMVVFLGADKLQEVVSAVEYPPETPVAVVYHASWDDERVVKGTLANIVERARSAGIERTALIVIGGVVEPDGYARSVLYA